MVHSHALSGRTTNLSVPSAATAFWAVLLCWAALLLVRIMGPADLMDKAQQQEAAYVQDIVHNGNWICPRDDLGRITSKPPLYVWLASLAAMPFGATDSLTLYLPCALAMLVNVWLIQAAGTKYFGRGTGLFAAVCYLLSFAGAQQILLARTDTLFSMTVFAAALYAFRAWTECSGATSFWLVAAAATLTKGPLGVLLGLTGLGAAWWEKRSSAAGDRQSTSYLLSWRSHGIGFTLFLVITLGWFLLAWFQRGSELIGKMIGDELVGHAMIGHGAKPLVGCYKPIFHFMTRFAPWSLLTLVGLWRVWYRPSAEASGRRFERFLFCQFTLGLLVFGLAAAHRADYVFPLLPAAALFAGRELARITGPARLLWTPFRLATVAACLIGAVASYYFGPRAHSGLVAKTRQMHEFAQAIERRVGPQFPLVHVDSPFALQFYMNTMSQRVSPTQAAELLSSDHDAFVVVRKPSKIESCLRGESTTVKQVARWPERGKAVLTVLSNHHCLESTRHMTTLVGCILVRMDGVRLLRSSEKELVIMPGAEAGRLTLTNQASDSREFRVRLAGSLLRVVRLAPAENYELDIPGRYQEQSTPTTEQQVQFGSDSRFDDAALNDSNDTSADRSTTSAVQFLLVASVAMPGLVSGGRDVWRLVASNATW